MPQVLTVLGVLVLATLLGLWWRSRNGRFTAVAAPVLAAAREGRAPAEDLRAVVGELGERATFVQLSSEVCAPCRATARVLTTLAAQEPGVRHVELDVAQHLDLVRTHDVRRTPTVLVLDAAGTVVGRTSGATDRAAALAALAAVPAADADGA
ncbi:thioredoxin family protein, partial [Cellulomonas massiliensis]|uniref:thioredoxin family protein n=1 Tax=Cellulomonas massiliensis TaxID=1465811 RepID=UPI000377E3A6